MNLNCSTKRKSEQTKNNLYHPKILMRVTPGTGLPLWSSLPLLLLFGTYLHFINRRSRLQPEETGAAPDGFGRGLFFFLLGCTTLYAGWPVSWPSVKGRSTSP
jgi:hypothetical protein